MIVGACCVAINAPCQGTKSLKSDRPGGPVGLEDLSRPADARQQPSHDSVVRLATAALKLVLLDGPFGEARGLICRLSLVLRKRHPLANDFPTRLVIFHVCGSLGCNFSTRLEATASFTVSRNSSGSVHAIRTASMWRVSRFPPPECREARALPPKNGLRLNDLRRTDQPSLDAFIDSHFEIRSAKPPPGVATSRDINDDTVSLSRFGTFRKSIAEIDRTNQIIPVLHPSRGASKGTVHKQPSPPTAWAE